MSYDALQQALRETMEVVEHGDQKHGIDAWRKFTPSPGQTTVWDVTKREKIVDHAAGAIRHLGHRIGGVQHEVESRRHHLAHAAARCLIALQLEIDRENGYT